MKRLYCILLMLVWGFSVVAQNRQPSVHYTIQAKLNTVQKTIDGQWEAVYINRTDSALHSIWVLLYPNAFSSDNTNYSKELLQWGNTSYYFAKPEERGWIDSLSFVINNGDYFVVPISHKFSEFLEIPLEKPLSPNDSIRLSTTFFTQIPLNYQNDGYKANDFILKVWCPLIADLGKDGWLLKPYSAFKTNKVAFADYSIAIDYPNNYAINTNGNLEDIHRYFYKGDQGFQWIASASKFFVTTNSLKSYNSDSMRTVVAKRIFPEVLRSNRAPEKASKWLGQVYSQYKQPVPFLDDGLYYKNDTIDVHKKLKLGLLYDFRHTDQYKYLFLSPAVGFNNYDKVMVVALIHNYQLPQQPLSFALAPMYATGSKKFAGWGNIDYNLWQEKTHWKIGLTGSTFSRRDFDIPDYPKFYQRMWRLVPSIDLTILDKESPSTKKWDIGFKSFILSEQNYSQFVTPTDTGFGNVTYRSTLFRLSAQLGDSRKLYPYSIALAADAGKEFLRLGLTGKYFFNYDATNRGVSARLFAGKFFYLKSQTGIVEAKNRVYNLGLSGASGLLDYTYSDYFIGRNESEGWMSQQIMERDGFFKMPTTNMSGGVLGLSDDWLTALNLAADFPQMMDPLQKVGGGLKLFFDFGTYSDLWSDVPPAGRFLYDAGLQISFCKSLINIYVPVIYSKVYKDKIPSQNRFWKTISFNINLSALKPRNSNFLWPQ